MGNVCFRKEECPQLGIDTPFGPFSLDGVLTFDEMGIADPEKAKKDLQEVFENNYSFLSGLILKQGYYDAKKGRTRRSFSDLPEKQRLYSLGYQYGSSHQTLAGPKGRLPGSFSPLELDSPKLRDYDLSSPEPDTPEHRRVLAKLTV